MNLTQTIASGMGVLLARSVPFVGYAVVANRIAWQDKIACALFFGCAVGATAWLGAPLREALVDAPLSLVYFALVGLAVHQLTRALMAGRLSQATVACILVTVCIGIPAFVLRTPGTSLALVVGWEVMLSSYSYCADSARARSQPSRAECLFFLLVNPILVYAERGRACSDEARTARGSARCVLGGMAWLAQAAILTGMAAIFAGRKAEPFVLGSTASYGYFAGYYSARLTAFYFAHSGLASVQIGFMMIAGHRVAERYHQPFLATSPLDFWRRWNIWLGSWARRYVFNPLGVVIRRKLRRFPADVALSLAVIATFLVVGLLHDSVRFAVRLASPTHGGPPMNGTLMFGIFGAVVVQWEGCSRLCEGSGLRKALRGLPIVVVSAASIVAVLHTVCLAHAASVLLTSGPADLYSMP